MFSKIYTTSALDCEGKRLSFKKDEEHEADIGVGSLLIPFKTKVGRIGASEF